MMELLDSLSNAYAGVYFSRKRGAALLFLAATLLRPERGLSGLACAVLAIAFARAAGLDRGRIRAGLYGVNALLVGLALASIIPPSMGLAVALVTAAVMAVLVTAALQSLFEGVLALPQMSLGFVLVSLVLSAFAAPPDAYSVPLSRSATSPQFFADYLSAISAVFFSGGLWAGLLVFAGLLYSSRIAAALSIVGFAAGALFASAGGALSPAGPSAFTGFNSAICAIALGGIYCVPSRRSYLLAAAAAALCVPIALWSDSLLTSSALGPLALPFLVTTCAAILALRTRTANTGPELVLWPGSPEENLAISRSRTMRFRPKTAWLKLPILGAWDVAQGADGEYTHKGPWRHAVDFSLPAAAPPKTAEDLAAYPAFGLPVLAPQRGIVALAVDGTADNALGAVDTSRNWGNHVSLRHDDGSYSLLAHLKKDSVKVRTGDPVAIGEIVGLCGNSGRSPTPHLHHHVQTTPEPGGKTLPFAYAVYLRLGGPPRLIENSLPRKGERVKNLSASPKMSAAFDFIPGNSYGFDVETARGRRKEALIAGIDLDGSRYLESVLDRTRLYYHRTDEMFYLDYCSAKPGSLLFAFLLGASKVPLTDEEGLLWSDELPLSPFLGGLLRFGAEFILPFIPGWSIKLERSFIRGQEDAPGLISMKTEIISSIPLAIGRARAEAVFSPEEGPLKISVSGGSAAVDLVAERTGLSC